jgi:hypothetical protein
LTRLIQTTCVSLIVLAVADGTLGQTAKIDPAWVYISQPLKWETPPKKLHLEIKTSDAEILILYPSGDLAVVACLLIRRRDGKIGISRGNGEVVRVGSWGNSGNSLTLTSHVVFRTLRLINSTTGRPVEPEIIEVVKRQDDSLRGDKERLFAHLRLFDDFEFLSLLANERETKGDEKTH